MLPAWDADRERRAKEVLYRCLEELGSTKAALYLLGSEGNFEVAAQYGFGRRDALAAQVDATSPLWDWIRRHRTAPAFTNDASRQPDLAALLAEAGTARLMTVPLSLDGRLVGFLDVRDKARREEFTADDQTRGRAIAGAMERLLRELGMYGAAAPTAAPASVEPEVGRLQAGPAHRLHEATLAEVARVARCCADLPGVAATALTVVSDSAVEVLLSRTVPLDPPQREALATHQLRHLAGLGVKVPPAGSWSWHEEEHAGGEHANEIATSLVVPGPPVWVVLSVLSSGGTVAETVQALVARHARLARQVETYRRAARNLARTLLEPGEHGMPALRQHAQAVSELAQRMAMALGLAEEEEELITVAGYLHDVGMREPELARIYRAERIGEVERRLFRRHATVGARIVEDSEFPGGLAAAIRHHHERWDGEGYPDRLRGDAIPLASRIVHLAEVYDVLTSAESYRRPMRRDAALTAIREEAGKQFDPTLVPVLEAVVGS